MFNLFLRQVVSGLRRRYKYTYRRDKQNFLRTMDYYTNIPRLLEILYIYNIFEIIFFCLRFFFKLIFWWPVLWPYMTFCYVVRYTFIPWHYFFLDLILPYLEKRLGGGLRAQMSYIYRFVKLIYRLVAWIERFLVNFFGLRLIWCWWRDLLLERIPDFLGRNSDNIAYGLLHFIEALIWVWTTWSRLWDYVMSWFNPWSYWKTRYYLSAYYREKLSRKYTAYNLKISVAYHNNEFYIRYYVALYFYGISLLFLNLRFFFSKPFILSHYKYYRYYNGGKFMVGFSFYSQKIFVIASAIFPRTASLSLSLYWYFIRFFLPILKNFFRLFYNYSIAPSWRWIKQRKKGKELGKGKFAGKWYSWFVNRRKS